MDGQTHGHSTYHTKVTLHRKKLLNQAECSVNVLRSLKQKHSDRQQPSKDGMEKVQEDNVKEGKRLGQ